MCLILYIEENYKMVNPIEIEKGKQYFIGRELFEVYNVYIGKPPIVAYKYSGEDYAGQQMPLKDFARKAFYPNQKFDSFNNLKVGEFYKNKFNKERQILDIFLDKFGSPCIKYVTINEPDNYEAHCSVYTFKKWLTRLHN